MVSSNIVLEILHANDIVEMKLSKDNFKEALSMGFSYIENDDHFVEYVITNPKTMKKILFELPEAELIDDADAIGHLWTAKLLLSKKLKDNEVVFSNKHYTSVLDLDINVNKMEENHGYV